MCQHFQCILNIRQIKILLKKVSLHTIIGIVQILLLSLVILCTHLSKWYKCLPDIVVWCAQISHVKKTIWQLAQLSLMGMRLNFMSPFVMKWQILQGKQIASTRVKLRITFNKYKSTWSQLNCYLAVMLFSVPIRCPLIITKWFRLLWLRQIQCYFTPT